MSDNPFDSPETRSRASLRKEAAVSLLSWKTASFLMACALVVILPCQLLGYFFFLEPSLHELPANLNDLDDSQRQWHYYIDLFVIWIPALGYLLALVFVGFAVLSHGKHREQFPEKWPLATVVLAVIGMLQSFVLLVQYLRYVS